MTTHDQVGVHLVKKIRDYIIEHPGTDRKGISEGTGAVQSTISRAMPLIEGLRTEGIGTRQDPYRHWIEGTDVGTTNSNSVPVDVEAVQRANNELRKQVNDLKRDLNDERQRRYDAEVRNPQPTVQDLERAGSQLMAEMRQQIEGLEKELSQLRVAHAQAAGDAENRRVQMAGYPDRIADLEGQISNLEERLAAETEVRGDAEAEANQLRVRVDTLDRDLKETQELLSVAESEREDAKREIEAYRTELHLLRKISQSYAEIGPKYDDIVDHVRDRYWTGEAIDAEHLRAIILGVNNVE